MDFVPRKRSATRKIVEGSATGTLYVHGSPHSGSGYQSGHPGGHARGCPEVRITGKSSSPNLPSINYAERSRRLHHQQSGPLTWTTASKTAFASALTRSVLYSAPVSRQC